MAMVRLEPGQLVRTSTPAVVAGHTSVVANGYMYVMSGSGTAAIYYAKLNKRSIDPFATNADSTFFVRVEPRLWLQMAIYITPEEGSLRHL